MSGVYPIPFGRSGALLLQQRLVHQLHADQQAILRLTSQLSTGRRLLAPSDDAPAAVRGVELQRILEQKAQARVNLSTTRSYLAASETALAQVAGLLNDVRAAAVQGADSTTSDAQRLALAQEVQAALTQLVNVGNQQFRQRRLFAGSLAGVTPYELQNGRILYRGNESELRSYADIDQLFSANVTGVAALGGLSAEVRGTARLTPVLSESTRLADLNGGAGVPSGSVTISDGTSATTVDLTGAATLGDVIARLEANPPANRQVAVRLGPTGLVVELDSGGGDLTISEVGQGKTAAALGILAPDNAATSIQGTPLNPRLRATTPLDDLLGVRASARLAFPGTDNDLILEAKANGDASNGVTVQFVDDDRLQAGPGLTAGDEFAVYSDTAVAARAALQLSGTGNDLLFTATTPGVQFNNVRIELQAVSGLGDAASAAYDANSRRLSIQIDNANQTTVASLIAAVEGTGLFTVSEDNTAGETLDPAAAVLGADAGVITGDTGNSGGAARTIFVHVERDRSTAAGVLAALQDNPDVAARFNVRLDGKDTSTPDAAGTGAIDLTVSAVTAGGSGEAFDRDAGLRIVVGDQAHVVTFSGAKTIEDLLNALNDSPAGLLAQINAAGEGIDIRSRVSGVDFHIGENGGVAAAQLGVRTFTRETLLADLNHGRGVHTADGADLRIRRADGVELEIDLSTAVTVGDVLDRINNHPDNQDPASKVTALLAAVGNGIELVDANPVVGEPLTVLRTTLSEAALDLGLVAAGETQATANPATNTLTGADANPLEAAGAFNSLIRLNAALLAGDVQEIGRAAALIDEDLDRLTFARGELGARLQSLETLEFRLQDEDLELRQALSEEIDADLVETISNLAGRQTALEASLRQSANTLRTTLLDYL